MAKADQWMDLARKLSRDPRVQSQIAKAFFSISTSDPALGRRLLAGDPQAVMEAYQTLVRNNGNIPMPSGPPRIGASPIGPGETVGGVSSPGVPVNPGTGLIPAPPRGLPNDPSATRQLTTTGGAAPDALDSAAREITVIDATPSTGMIPADAGALVPSGRRGPGVRVGGVVGPPTRYGTRGVPAVPDAPPPRGGLPAWAVPAAAAAYGTAVGIGAYNSVNRDGPVADDLDAAATEIAPDEEVGAPAGRTWRDMSDEEMVANLPQGDVPGGGVGVRRGELDAYGRRYRQAIHNTIDRGVEARQAARAAEERAASRNAGWSDIETPDVGYGAATFTLPDGREGVMVNGRAVPAHLDATGRPLGGGRYYTLGAENRVIEAEREAMRAAGGNHGVPGPRTDDGRPTELPPTFSTPGEADDYFTRKRDPKTGALMPSKADIAMRQRGFEPVFTPRGDISYRPASPTDGMGGIREDIAPAHRRYNEFLTGTDAATGETVEPRYQSQVMNGPFGPVRVLVPTAGTREKEARRQENQSIDRIATRTGRSPEEIEKMPPEDRARLVSRTAAAEERGRRNLWRESARLARGSHNINSQNGAFFNALAMLEGVNPDRMDAQQQAMMQMMPMDRNRAAVEAANNAQLTQLGLRVAQGQGFQQPLPEQRAAAQQQLEMQMAPEERAALYRDKPEVHPAEVAMADAHVAERYSAPGSVWGLGGLSSGFSSDEQQQTIDWLVNEKGYSPAKAQKIVDNIASKRRGQSWHTLW